MTNDAIELLLEAARREEREACAKLIEEQRAKHQSDMVEACCSSHRRDAALMADVCFQNISAIRARSND